MGSGARYVIPHENRYPWVLYSAIFYLLATGIAALCQFKFGQTLGFILLIPVPGTLTVFVVMCALKFNEEG